MVSLGDVCVLVAKGTKIAHAAERDRNMRNSSAATRGLAGFRAHFRPEMCTSTARA